MPTVVGAIADRWNALGGPNSYLRQPITDEMEFFEDGRVSVFEGGAIYWWPDMGAVDMVEIFVNFTGLNCFNITGSPGSDDPYVVIGVSAPNREPLSLRSQIYNDVDQGDTRPDRLELYRGSPGGITIIYELKEHDEDNPDLYKAAMQGVASAASAGVTELIKLIPKVGPILAVGAGPVLSVLNPIVATALGSIFGFEDDRIGVGTIVLSPKQMVQLAIQPPLSERQVGYKFATPNLTGDGGNYRVYFDAVKAP